MSAKEQKRVDYLRLWEKGEMLVRELVEAMKVSERQVYRVIACYRERGIEGVVHGLRGQPSNNVTDEKLKTKIGRIFERDYRDYGPTLLAEVLLKNHGIEISDETLRVWFAGKWVLTRKSRKHRKKRERRSAIGMMVQFDGSDHDWFEGRAPCCCLFVAVDDASGRTYARMATSENAYDAILAFKIYCERYGIPLSVYTDRHKV